MKLLFAILTYLLLIPCDKTAAQSYTVTGTFYSNPYLATNIPPMSLPTGPSSIAIIAPSSMNLNSIQLPSYTINVSNIDNPVILSAESYTSYSSIMGISDDVIKANHNLTVAKILHDIDDRVIEKGCSSISRISVDAAQKALAKACIPLKAPSLPTVIACAVSKLLNEAIIKKTTQTLVEKGCTVTVKFVKKNIVEIAIQVKKDFVQSLEEAKNWLAFMNSLEGMIWIMYILDPIGHSGSTIRK